jgi:hypothetical protein
MNRFIILFFLSLCAFTSCKKIVTLDLNNTSPQLVIQGEVTDSAGPYTVMINQTVDFYADNNFPTVSAAVVKISDDKGVTDSLIETAPGIYRTRALKGKAGNTYNLSVFVQNKTYTASSTMPAPVILDSVSFLSNSAFGTKRTSAVVNFQDPAGVSNYYQFIENINGKQYTKSFFIFEDRLSDGKYITTTLRTDSTYFKTGDQLEIKMYCIDKNIFAYFNQLNQSSGGNNTAASPANPSSNISSGAYGYFSAHTTQSKKVIAR